MRYLLVILLLSEHSGQPPADPTPAPTNAAAASSVDDYYPLALRYRADALEAIERSCYFPAGNSDCDTTGIPHNCFESAGIRFHAVTSLDPLFAYMSLQI